MDKYSPQSPNIQELPLSLRILKGLVILLMITMIIGVIIVVSVFVSYLPKSQAQIQTVIASSVASGQNLPQFPENLTLPKGEQATAVTYTQDWILIVTQKNTLYLFTKNGELKQARPLLEP